MTATRRTLLCWLGASALVPLPALSSTRPPAAACGLPAHHRLSTFGPDWESVCKLSQLLRRGFETLDAEKLFWRSFARQFHGYDVFGVGIWKNPAAGEGADDISVICRRGGYPIQLVVGNFDSMHREYLHEPFECSEPYSDYVEDVLIEWWIEVVAPQLTDRQIIELARPKTLEAVAAATYLARKYYPE